MTADQLDRYLELAIFPEDVDVDRAVVERLWAATGGWTSFQTHRFWLLLADLSLVLTYAGPAAAAVARRASGYLRHAPPAGWWR